MKNGKFVYKSEESMMKMQEFYDKTLASLKVEYSEDFFETSYGKTHCLLVGDTTKPRICTIHGGNGISTLNLKLFMPLLSEFCIIAPDVIGMPGKSAPYRISAAKKMSTACGSGKCSTTMQIDSPHLPPEDVMIDVCNKTVSFFKQST